jgi:hypothetical protein
LIPSIISKTNKPSKISSLLIGLILSLITLCYATLDLWLSAASASLGCLAWWILFVQALKMPLKTNKSGE